MQHVNLDFCGGEGERWGIEYAFKGRYTFHSGEKTDSS